eukprot:6360950-Pyramimonas_sp.AAC.1
MPDQRGGVDRPLEPASGLLGTKFAASNVVSSSGAGSGHRPPRCLPRQPEVSHLDARAGLASSGLDM